MVNKEEVLELLIVKIKSDQTYWNKLGIFEDSLELEFTASFRIPDKYRQLGSEFINIDHADVYKISNKWDAVYYTYEDGRKSLAIQHSGYNLFDSNDVLINTI
jgi:hypothetical protein